MLKNYLKKDTFSRNVDLFEHMGKKYFFKEIYSKIPFARVAIWRYGLKTIFLSDLKKLAFLRSVDIYVDMIYSELGREFKNFDVFWWGMQVRLRNTVEL